MTNTGARQPTQEIKARTILAEVHGFTPLLDVLVERHGVVTAAVFGIIWRYCQMSEAACTASIERLAGELGLTRRTVMTHISTLLEEGYIKDLTPGVRNKPHRYVDTGKAGLVARIEAQTQNGGEVGKIYTPGVQNLPIGCANFAHEERSKKAIIIQEPEQPAGGSPGNGNGSPPKPNLSQQQLMVGELSNVTGLDYKISSNAKRLAKFASELIKAGYTPEQIKYCYSSGGIYYQQHWKGKEKQKPDERVIAATIKDYASTYKPPVKEDEHTAFKRLNPKQE